MRGIREVSHPEDRRARLLEANHRSGDYELDVLARASVTPHAAIYMYLRCALMLLRRFFASFCFRSVVSGMKYMFRRIFEMRPSCCTRLLKRRSSWSKPSPSSSRTSAKQTS